MFGMDHRDSPPPMTPTGTKVGWRRPALVLALVLVGLVGLVRLGATDERPVVTPAGAAATGAVAALPITTPVTVDRPLTLGRISGAMPRSADGLTYADGIPTGIRSESVFRVRDVMLVPIGRTLLIGGWSRTFNCQVGMTGRSCPPPTLSDVPLEWSRTGDLSTSFVALDAPLVGRGAHIVLVTVEPDPHCSIHWAGECLPRLHVLQQIWSEASQ